MEPGEGVSSRPYEDKDLSAVCDLLNLCSAVGKLEDSFSVEQLGQRLATPSLDRFNDQRVWVDVAGGVVGFAQVWNLSSIDSLGSYFYFRVHPDVRGRGIEREIIEWGIGRAHEAGEQHGLRAVLKGRIFEHDSYSKGIFEMFNFEIARYGFRMARPLSIPIPEPVLPEGYTLRHAMGENDIEPWVACFNESFIDHWGFNPDSVEERRHRLERPGYRPEQDLVAVAPDGSFAAFCLWEMDRVGNAIHSRRDGWISELGTRRGHRRIGLGRAMLLAGLQHLKDEGADTAKLGVDAANPTGALGLYERAGFEKIATRVSYHMDV